MVAGVMTMRWNAILFLCSVSFAVAAEPLQDPTRPLMGTGEGEVVSTANANQRPNSKGLLSVIISPTRCAAVIDGKTFRLGDKYGDSTLVEITPRGVVLRGANGLRNMGLFPGVGVTVVAQGATTQAVSCKIENYKIDKKSTRLSGLKEKK